MSYIIWVYHYWDPFSSSPIGKPLRDDVVLWKADLVLYLKARAIKQCGNLVRTHLVTHLTDTWWLTPVISVLTLLIPFITGVITHLLSGMSHQVFSGRITATLQIGVSWPECTRTSGQIRLLIWWWPVIICHRQSDQPVFVLHSWEYLFTNLLMGWDYLFHIPWFVDMLAMVLVSCYLKLSGLILADLQFVPLW